jgi:hypothetical protein
MCPNRHVLLQRCYWMLQPHHPVATVEAQPIATIEVEFLYDLDAARPFPLPVNDEKERKYPDCFRF